MHMHALRIVLAMILLILLCPLLMSQGQPPQQPTTFAPSAEAPVPNQQRVFVFVQRSDRHAKYSKPEMFHDVLNDILNYLATKKVAVAVDEFGGRNHAEGAMPMDTVFSIAREAKANSVLYFVVDRPATKWLKVTAQCFDMNGKQLWQEEASSGGGFSGAHGFDVTTERLHGELDKHIGQEGVPVLVSVPDSSPGKQ